MSDRNSLQWALFFFVMAFVLSGAIAFILTGVTILEELEIFGWTHDIKSISPQIQDQISNNRLIGTLLEYGGFGFLIIGIIVILVAYKKIK
jgi:hypothetical protein